MFALVASFISFCITRQNINFAFYFFVLTRSASREGSRAYLESKSEGHRFTFGQIIKLMYANLLGPLLVSLLFMHELTGSVVMSALGIDELSW